jgi:hypothetical protein
MSTVPTRFHRQRQAIQSNPLRHSHLRLDRHALIEFPHCNPQIVSVPMQSQLAKSVGKSRRNSDSIKRLPLGISTNKKQIQPRAAKSCSSLLNSRCSPYLYLASFNDTRKKGNGSESTERITAGLPSEITLFTSTHQCRYSPVLVSLYPNS